MSATLLLTTFPYQMMAAMPQAAVDPDENAFAIELSGRRYPQLPGALSSGVRTRTLRAASGTPTLEDCFAASLRATLPNSGSADGLDRSQLCRQYSEGLQQLAQARGDLEDFLGGVCRVNLAFRQLAGPTHEGARDSALTKQHEEMLQAIGQEWPPRHSILDAGVASLPVETLAAALQESIESATKEFAQGACRLLARLVDEQLLGLVEWLPDHCCAYHYFQRVVLQENVGPATHRKTHAVPSSVGPERAFERVTHVHGEGRHVYRCARHEHTLINAMRSTLGNSAVALPPPVADLMKDLPPWLAELIQVVTGDLVRHRMIERDLSADAWVDATVTDRPLYDEDPALVIGPYVLTGWIPAAPSRLTASSGVHTPVDAAKQATMTAAAALLGVLSLAAWGVAPLLVPFAFLLALVAAWEAAHRWRPHVPTSELFAYWTCAAVGLALAATHTLVLGLPWAAPISMLLGAAICGSVAAQFSAPSHS